MRIPSWLQVVMSIAILAVVLWHVPVEKRLAAARSAELIWLFPAAATTLVMLFFRHFKWHRLLRAAGLPASVCARPGYRLVAVWRRADAHG